MKRPQMQMPPCMNTSCGCGADLQPLPIRPNTPPMTTLPVSPVQQMPSSQPAQPRPGMTEHHQMPLSCMALAMGYVPWQRWGQTYSLEQSLNRGTIFPELDLPFVMGRCRG